MKAVKLCRDDKTLPRSLLSPRVACCSHKKRPTSLWGKNKKNPRYPGETQTGGAGYVLKRGLGGESLLCCARPSCSLLLEVLLALDVTKQATVASSNNKFP